MPPGAGSRQNAMTMADHAHALDALFAPYDRPDGPGLLVGVAHRGEVIYREAFGLASVQHGVPNNPGTRIRIASTSKHFTALAALLLAEDGRLDLDAPADRYLPGLPGPRGMPSLRQFTQHTSGLRCTLDMGTLANGYAPQPPDWQLRAMLRQSDVNFAPGEAQLYCNGTYHALSLAIERIAGMPFEEFLKRRIFEPLGLRGTDAVADDSLMVPGMASPHVRAPHGGWQRPPSDSELRGDGGMVSTIDDMLAWLAHLRGPKRIGSAKTWQELLTPPELPGGARSTYAMGLKRHMWRGIEVIHHSGGLLGLNCQMLTAPAQALDIFIACNGASVSATLLAREVMQHVIGPVLTPPLRQPQAREWARLVGARYASKGGELFTFAAVNGALGLSLMNMVPAPVLWDDGDAICARFEEIGMGPYRWRKSDLHGEAPELPGLERLPREFTPRSDSLRALAETYRSHDLDADARITMDGDAPLLELRGDYSAWRPFRLTPLSPSHFALEGLLDPGERYSMTADPSSRPGEFVVDTYRARRLRFVSSAHGA